MGSVWKQLHAGNQSELRGEDADADAFDPGSHRHPHDG